MVCFDLTSRGNHPRTLSAERSLPPAPPPDKAVTVLLLGVLCLVFSLKCFSRLVFDIRDLPHSNTAKLGTEGLEDDIMSKYHRTIFVQLSRNSHSAHRIRQSMGWTMPSPATFPAICTIISFQGRHKETNDKRDVFVRVSSGSIYPSLESDDSLVSVRDLATPGNHAAIVFSTYIP